MGRISDSRSGLGSSNASKFSSVQRSYRPAKGKAKLSPAKAGFIQAGWKYRSFPFSCPGLTSKRADISLCPVGALYAGTGLPIKSSEESEHR